MFFAKVSGMKRCAQPFILLEIFIALTILALVIIPLSTFPFKAAKKEKEAMLAVECERIYGLAQADLLDRIETIALLEEADLGTYTATLSSVGSFDYNAKVILTEEAKSDKHILLNTEIVLSPEIDGGFSPKERKSLLYIDKK